jgi:ribonuclease P protein component
MIPGAHRFHGYASLRGVYRRGRTVRGQLASLKFAQRAPGKPYRAAVVVSRKVSKSAVVRNRIRRRFYEILRTTDTPIPPGADLVFTVYGAHATDLPAAKLREAVEELLKKAYLAEPGQKE